jgi:hypothetical protein
MVLSAIGVIVGFTIIMLFLFLRERGEVSSMNMSAPIECTTLMFSSNVARCDETLYAHFAPLPPLEREPVCGRIDLRASYGRSATLCAEYDIALSEKLHAPDLAEFGVSVWEPAADVTNDGSIVARTRSVARGITLICANAVVETSMSPTSENSDADGPHEYALMLSETIAGDCELIASTPEGSVTSRGFVLRTK